MSGFLMAQFRVEACDNSLSRLLPHFRVPSATHYHCYLLFVCLSYRLLFIYAYTNAYIFFGHHAIVFSLYFRPVLLPVNFGSPMRQNSNSIIPPPNTPPPKTFLKRGKFMTRNHSCWRWRKARRTCGVPADTVENRWEDTGDYVDTPYFFLHLARSIVTCSFYDFYLVQIYCFSQ